MKLKSLIVLSFAAIFYTGCYESKLEYVLNPDGSGKVMIEVKMNAMAGGMMGGTESSKGASSFAEKMFKTSGIDTWKDVEVKMLEDGRTYFKGTAYFPDVSAVKFKDISMGEVGFYKDEQNNMVLDILQENNTKQKSGSAKKNLTKDELDKEIQKQKGEYQQMKPMLGMFLGTMKTDLTFQLPGKVEKSTNLSKTKDGRLTVNFSGEKILAAMDKMTANEEWWKEQAMGGSGDKKKISEAAEEFNQYVFGEKGPIRAIVKGPVKTLFDYKKEMEESEKNFEAMLTKLNLGGSVAKKVETYKGGNFKSLTVGRVSMSDLSDPNNTLFGNDRTFKISVIGELPGAILKVDKIKLQKAQTDNGEDVLPEEWLREAGYASLSNDKTAAMWELSMSMPSDQAKGFKEISGSILCQIPGQSKWVDLGIKKFAANEIGQLDSKIESVEDTDYRHSIKMKVKMPYDRIKTVQVLDARGKEVKDVNKYGYDSGDDLAYLEIYSENPLPTQGTLKLEFYDTVVMQEIPFSIQNVTLWGKPLK